MKYKARVSAYADQDAVGPEDTHNTRWLKHLTPRKWLTKFPVPGRYDRHTWADVGMGCY